MDHNKLGSESSRQSPPSIPQALLDELGKILGRFLAAERKLTQDESEQRHDRAQSR